MPALVTLIGKVDVEHRVGGATPMRVITITMQTGDRYEVPLSVIGAAEIARKLGTGAAEPAPSSIITP